jgi:hypothetical protein
MQRFRSPNGCRARGRSKLLGWRPKGLALIADVEQGLYVLQGAAAQCRAGRV